MPEPENAQARLEYLRGEIRAERISYGELAELADLAEHIDPGDVELLEWAGVPEFPAEDVRSRLAGMEVTDDHHMYAVTHPSSSNSGPIISLYRSFDAVVACVEQCEEGGIEGVNVHWLLISDAEQ